MTELKAELDLLNETDPRKQGEILEGDYDYSGKMKALREDWKTCNVTSCSVMLPEKYHTYLKAVAKMASGEALLTQVEERDPSVLERFAQRQPRLGRDLGYFRDLVAYAKDVSASEEDSIVIEALVIIELYEKIEDARRKGNAALLNNDTASVFYWYAKEYALSMYIKGAVELHILHKAGDAGLGDVSIF